jgi:hypothetical protein
VEKAENWFFIVDAFMEMELGTRTWGDGGLLIV